MEDYSELVNKLSELGFSRFNSFNSSDGEIEFWKNIELGSPYIASIEFYQDSSHKLYIRFSYISKCLGSSVKSMPLHSRNKDIDRFMREYEQFNDMITTIRNIGY